MGGAVGGAASIVLLPAAPYYWYKGITSLINDKAYGGPLKQFQNIAAQMGLVDKHLHQITGALGDIETRLGEATKAEKKVISYDGEKKERKRNAKERQKERQRKAEGRQEEGRGKAKGRQKEGKGKAEELRREGERKAKGRRREGEGQAKGRQRAGEGQAKGRRRKGEGKAKVR